MSFSDSEGEFISNMLSFFLLFLTLLFLPIGLISILCVKPQRLHEEDFESRWGAFYEGTKTNSKYAMAYNLCFVLRRLIFLSIALLN